VPQRRGTTAAVALAGDAVYAPFHAGAGEREQSTTMAFVRLLTRLLRDGDLGPRVVPIVADEARTFGMQDLFRQFGIYSPWGQRYTPQDREQLAFYREEVTGQILEEGITEAGALSSWIAAGTAYAHSDAPMLPCYIFYSMFGFQRVADLIWSAADSQARGFLLGATAGRTTLSGEGLQHEDGQSHVYAATVPSCRAYDPAFGYEVAVIVEEGIRRMLGAGENGFYYITLYNEPYPQPAMPAGAAEGIRRGLYLLRPAALDAAAPRVQLLGSGSLLRQALAAAARLEREFGVAADVCSVTSYGELRRDGLACERWNRLHPGQPPRIPYVTAELAARGGPVVAVSDFVRAYPELVRPWVPGRYTVLGTDGFGRSDTRSALRDFFEVDARYLVLAALQALVADGALPPDRLQGVLQRLQIDPDKADPLAL